MSAVPKDQAVWNAIFSALFIVIFVSLFWGLTDGLDRFDWLYLIDTMDVVIIALATFRVIRLVSFDKTSAFVRHWFLDIQKNGSRVKPSGGPRRAIAEFSECLWCTGLWASLFVTVLYFSADVGRFLVIILAVAAAGSFFVLFSQMIGRIGK